MPHRFTPQCPEHMRFPHSCEKCSRITEECPNNKLVSSNFSYHSDERNQLLTFINTPTTDTQVVPFVIDGSDKLPAHSTFCVSSKDSSEANPSGAFVNPHFDIVLRHQSDDLQPKHRQLLSSTPKRQSAPSITEEKNYPRRVEAHESGAHNLFYANQCESHLNYSMNYENSPTQQTIRSPTSGQHDLLHMNERNICKHCVQSRAKRTVSSLEDIELFEMFRSPANSTMIKFNNAVEPIGCKRETSRSLVCLYK